MPSLESKNYVATLEDVAAITRKVIEARATGQDGRATYLRALIATTIAELGENPRQRAPGSTPGKLSEDEKLEQLAALEKVGERFYVVVVKAAREKIEGPDRGGLILNRSTGFARSSLSTARKWIRHGNDITSLVPSRVTKAMLYIPGKRKGPSPKVLTNQTRRFATRLEKSLTALAAADRDAAAEQWERLKAHMERILRSGRGGGARVGVSRVARGSLQQAA